MSADIYVIGLSGYIAEYHTLIDDCYEYFLTVKSQHKYLPIFISGGSLGAAVALGVHLKDKTM